MEIKSWISQRVDLVRPFSNAIEINGLLSRLNSKIGKNFAEGISELCVASHYLEKYPDGFMFPRGKKNKKNIDISYVVGGQRVNIEIKCPDLSYKKKNKFTLHSPYMYGNLSEGKELEKKMVEMMSGNMDVVPNKILTLRERLDECESKFKESSDEGDVNFVLFSMLDLDWLDSYRIKLEDENQLSGYKKIHAVILSGAAHYHQRETNVFIGDFGRSFNYVIANGHSSGDLPRSTLEMTLDTIPHQTKEAKAWYLEQVKNDDPIGIGVKSIQRLKLFCKMAYRLK